MFESLFNKVLGLKACNFMKKTATQVLSCEICWILRTHIFKNICERLLLVLQEELLNSFSKILHFNECLWIFLIFYHMVMHHEQYVFIIHDWAGRERNNFQQIPKLIELKFISTTWPHYSMCRIPNGFKILFFPMENIFFSIRCTCEFFPTH